MRFLQLGATANLLLGLRPQWGLANGGPLFAPPRQAFVPLDASVATRGKWQEPTLSVHDDANGLLDAIFDFRVLPFQMHRTPFHVPPSALLCRDLFGIGLSPDAHYLLVTMRREDADFMHEGVRGGIGRPIQINTYWTPEGRHAMGRLRTSERMGAGAGREATATVRQARRYLDYCWDYGTHFVSRIVAGDLVLQIFTCEPSRYRHVKEAVRRETGGTRVSGSLARTFALFTRPEWSTAQGILNASGDPRLTGLDDILTTDPAALPVDETAPVMIALTPQTSFMEVFRASVFRRVVKGAMLQKFGPLVRFPAARTDVDVPEEFTFPSTIAFSILLRDTPPLAAKKVEICVYRTSPRPIDGALGTLELSDEAFAAYEFVTREMEGGLFVTNRDGSRRETLFEGLRFAGEARVELRDFAKTSSCDIAAEAIRTIDYAETLLRRPSSTKEEVAFARGYLLWLASLLTTHRVRLLDLARVAGPWTHEESVIDSAEVKAIAVVVAQLAIETRHVMNEAGLRDVAERVNTMLQTADSPIRFAEEVEAARTRAVRAAEKAGETAIIDMLSSKPIRLADVREGDAPFCRFSQLVFGIGTAFAATDAAEMLAEGSTERAASLLDVLEATADLPTEHDWQRLADVAPDHEDLRSALRELAIAGPWIESRMRRARQRIDRIPIDTGNDPIAAKWRLIEALARLEHRLGAKPVAKLELSALAHSLAHAVV